MKNMFEKRENYSIAALFLIIICEIITIVGIRNQCYTMIAWVAMSLFIISVILIAIGSHKQFRFLPNTSIFAKLLSNVVSPNWLGVAYLLVFIIHIGWLSDGSLYQSNQNPHELFVMLMAGIIGILVLACFFPEGKVSNKEVKKKKVFVSGISNFPTPTPSQNRPPVPWSSFNLIPLISILDIAWREREKCEMLILKSDLFKKGVPCIYVDRADELGLNKIADSDYATYGVEQTGNDVDDKLRLIIKKVALAVYSVQDDNQELLPWIKDLTIHFTAPCDYDNFPDCFSQLQMSLSKFANSYSFYFNLSPGTAIVSAVMSLLSIDNNCELYYYKQKNDDQRLQKVDKTKIPMENLLSQALETLRKS